MVTLADDRALFTIRSPDFVCKAGFTERAAPESTLFECSAAVPCLG
jgi:hypothetical protein